MFFAINSETNERVNSLTIQQNGLYQLEKEDLWFADPDEIDTCPKEIDINKIIVCFREGKKGVINFKGTEYDTSPHFFIPNKSKLGINVVPESKEHKLAKNWIYNKIKDNNLILNYSEVSKPYKYNNQINLFDLPLDKSKIGIEVTSSTQGLSHRRRADIICPFIVKHPLLGNGVVIEIQFSNQRESTTTDRSLDWAIRGYSIAWLWKEDFENINDMLIETKKQGIDVSSFATLIKENNKSLVRNLKWEVQEQLRKIESYKKELLMEITNKKLESNKEEIELIAYHYFEELKSRIQPKCPKCGTLMMLKKSNGDKFWGCGQFPNCRSTMVYIE